MADLSWHQNRIRGGTRGGQEQFKWDDIAKMDYKERDHYLGSSAMVGMQGQRGVFQRNNWWQGKRGGDDLKKLAEEKDALRAFEEEAMLEALGEKPANIIVQKQKMTAEQMRQALMKGDSGVPGDAAAKLALAAGSSAAGSSASGSRDSGGAAGLANNSVGVESAQGLGFSKFSSVQHEANKAALLGVEDKLAGACAFGDSAFSGAGPAAGASSSSSSSRPGAAGPGGAAPGAAKLDALKKYTGGVDVGEYVASHTGAADGNAAALPKMWTEEDDDELRGEGRSRSEQPAGSAGGTASATAGAIAGAPAEDSSSAKLDLKRQRRDEKQERKDAKRAKKDAKKRKKEEKKARKKEKKEKRKLAKARKKEKKSAKERARKKDSKKRDSSSSESESDSSASDSESHSESN